MPQSGIWRQVWAAKSLVSKWLAFVTLRTDDALVSRYYARGSIDATVCSHRIPYLIRSLHFHVTHGARSVLRAASVGFSAGRHLDELRSWALKVQGRTNHNKAACSLAHKRARICYATLRDGEEKSSRSALKQEIRKNFVCDASLIDSLEI